MSLLKEYLLIFQEGTEDKVSLERKVPLMLLRKKQYLVFFCLGFVLK